MKLLTKVKEGRRDPRVEKHTQSEKDIMKLYNKHYEVFLFLKDIFKE